jgi:hypothetical protein
LKWALLAADALRRIVVETLYGLGEARSSASATKSKRAVLAFNDRRLGVGGDCGFTPVDRELCR